MISYSKHNLLFFAGLAVAVCSSVGHAQQLFPIAPYSGMQLSYTLTGVEVTDSKDSEDLMLVRTLQGELLGEEIRLNGEFLCRSPDRTEFRVELSVDEQTQEVKFSNDDAALKLISPQSFDLKIPVPRGSRKIGLAIVAKTETILGPSMISLLGQFTVVDASPAQGLHSNSLTRVAVGKIAEQLRGEVQIRSVDDKAWSAVVEGEQFFVGSRIRTQSNSSVLVTVANGDQLLLDQNSEIIFRENGVMLARGSLKLCCSPAQSVRIIWTADYITEFIGHHLGLDYVNSRTIVSNIDGSATTTLQAGSSKGVVFQSAIRAEGDERGLDHFKSIDLAQEDKIWKQLGMGEIMTPTPEHTKMGEPNPNEIPESETTTATDRPESNEVHGVEKIPIEIPANPKIRLIVFDSTGGHTPQRTSNEPELVIYADGRTVITDPFGKHPNVTLRLSADNIKSFLEFVVNEHHFYDMSTESLQKLIEPAKAQGGVPEFKDLSTAIIRIGIQNKTYEVRCLAPDYFSSQFPEAEPLQHYEAIYHRLKTFITASREWADKQKR